jgi:hypothetical protein
LLPKLTTRIDINVTDLTIITSRLSKQTYFTQEVVYGAGQEVQPDMYTGIGALSLVMTLG